MCCPKVVIPGFFSNLSVALVWLYITDNPRSSNCHPYQSYSCHHRLVNFYSYAQIVKCHPLTSVSHQQHSKLGSGFLWNPGKPGQACLTTSKANSCSCLSNCVYCPDVSFQVFGGQLNLSKKGGEFKPAAKNMIQSIVCMSLKPYCFLKYTRDKILKY